jgi:choline dehydrogenase-like flavoprotein
MIEAGAAVGMRPVDDMNASDDERIGPAMSTIHRGRRVSAAHAFLHPVRRRPNLQIETGAHATRLLVEGDRAAGVCAQQRGRNVEFRARREVVLCLGSIGTPKLLQLSGIGPSAVLRAAGIDVRVDQSFVGGRMREHRCFPLQARLSQNLGSNRKLATPFAQLRTSLEYLLTRRGPLATPSYDVVGFLKSAPGRDRVDAQILFAPTSVASRVPGENPQIEREPGIHCIGYVLRPTSEGSVHITSADPSAALRIVANYLATPEDQEVGLGVFRRMREMFASDALAPFIERETVPGPSVEDDAALIEMALEHGFCGYHAVGTCAMGPDERDVVDARLRVRGVDQLRVMDCSVLPTMIAGNLNGPMMAMANIAADIILEGD